MRFFCPFCYAGHGHCIRCGLVLVHGETRHSARTARGVCVDGDGPVRCLCGGTVVAGGVQWRGARAKYSTRSILDLEADRRTTP